MKNKTLRNALKTYKRYFKKLISLKQVEPHSPKIHWLKKRLVKLQLFIKNRIEQYQLNTRKVVSGTALLFAAATSVHAQIYEFKPSANPFNGVFIESGVSKPHFVDFDGDGDDDLFISGYSNGDDGNSLNVTALKYYENTENGFVLKESPIQADLGIGQDIDTGGSVISADFIDFDGDGDIDAFVTAKGTLKIAYLENVDGMLVANEEANPFNEVAITEELDQIAFGDMNADGNIEAFLAVEDTLKHFGLNDGKYSFIEDIYSGGDYPVTEIFDIDNDGDLDLLVGNKYGDIHVFENTGVAFEELMDHPLTNLPTYLRPALSFTDVNNDGDLDAVLGKVEGGIFYHENEGGNYNYMPFNNLGLSFYGATNAVPEFADIDGDGDMDMLVGQVLSTLRYVENTEEGYINNIVDNQFTILNGVDFLYTNPTCDDIDNDGDVDCIVSSDFDRNSVYLRNDEGTFMPVDSVDSPFSTLRYDDDAKTYAFEDIDGDGDLDLLMSNKYGELYFFFNNNGVYTQANIAFPENGINGYADPVFVDVDNDGDNDLVVTDEEGIVHFFERGFLSFTEMIGEESPMSPLNEIGIAKVAFTDFDGDGDLDVLGVDRYGRALHFDNILLQSSIPDYLVKQDFSIFPNPSNGFLTLEVPWLGNGGSLSIMDVQGKIIYRSNMDDFRKTLTVTNFPDGHYFIKVVSKDKVGVKKLIIQH